MTHKQKTRVIASRTYFKKKFGTKKIVIQFMGNNSSIMEKIADMTNRHTVGLLCFDPSKPSVPSLIGTGTLVHRGNKYAILTAGHVISPGILQHLAVSPNMRLGLITKPTLHLFSLSMSDLILDIIDIVSPEYEYLGPDIGVIRLLEPAIDQLLASNKIFYNLERHRCKKKIPNGYGFWFATGYPKQLSIPPIVGSDGILACGFTSYTYGCQIKNYQKFRKGNRHGRDSRYSAYKNKTGYDYCEIPAYQEGSMHGKGKSCTDFPGASGSGLWHFPIEWNRKTKQVELRRPNLAGVVFYQTVDYTMKLESVIKKTKKINRMDIMLRAHCKNSINNKLYNYLK